MKKALYLLSIIITMTQMVIPSVFAIEFEEQQEKREPKTKNFSFLNGETSIQFEEESLDDANEEFLGHGVNQTARAILKAIAQKLKRNIFVYKIDKKSNSSSLKKIYEITNENWYSEVPLHLRYIDSNFSFGAHRASLSSDLREFTLLEPMESSDQNVKDGETHISLLKKYVFSPLMSTVKGVGNGIYTLGKRAITGDNRQLGMVGGSVAGLVIGILLVTEDFGSLPLLGNPTELSVPYKIIAVIAASGQTSVLLSYLGATLDVFTDHKTAFDAVTYCYNRGSELVASCGNKICYWKKEQSDSAEKDIDI